MTPSEAELIAAAKAYVHRQDAPFSAESWRAWDRLREAVRVVDTAPPEIVRKCVPARPASQTKPLFSPRPDCAYWKHCLDSGKCLGSTICP